MSLADADTSELSAMVYEYLKQKNMKQTTERFLKESKKVFKGKSILNTPTPIKLKDLFKKKRIKRQMTPIVKVAAIATLARTPIVSLMLTNPRKK